MKIELQFTDPKEELPEEDGYYLIYTKSSISGKTGSEEASYYNGVWEDYLGELIPHQSILLWAKMPNYDELIKNKRLNK
jgi:hypothetical protein